ncbi:MAG TPA: molybdopterin-dependent oxidoreductase [Erysipelotrichaceae bacterium]|nr:molybdopterin-dependent oxidoreductase [Erysipelotrichaceae bacterium]
MKIGKMFILIIMFILNACSVNPEVDVHTDATLSRFRSLEIQEYEGKLLDPAIGPRDNSITGVQEIDINKYQLKITGLVNNEISLSYQDVLEMTSYQRLITLYCVEGWDATILWEGVLLTDLIDLGEAKSTANTVIFHAEDGYTTSLPYAVIKDRQLILAYKANGIALPNEMGYPFIVVAENKLGYKWARWVTEIELSSEDTYKGYWESLGYDNDAEVE